MKKYIFVFLFAFFAMTGVAYAPHDTTYDSYGFGQGKNQEKNSDATPPSSEINAEDSAQLKETDPNKENKTDSDETDDTDDSDSNNQ